MADPSEVAQWVAGGGAGAVALYKAVEWLVLGRLKKAEKAEEQAEETRDAKLDAVLEVVQRLDRDLSLLTQSLSTHVGTVAEVKGRLEGMSANYGSRLSQVEKDVVELRTLLKRRSGR